jgi:hypothetical protein
MTRLLFICALLVSLGTRSLAQAPGGILTNPASPLADPPTDCDSKYFPDFLADGSSGGSPSCCQKGAYIYQVVPKLMDGQVTSLGIGIRQIGPHACSTKTGETTCQGHQCYFGPCGVAKLESPPPVDPLPPGSFPGTEAVIFHPSQGKVCGYQFRSGQHVLISEPELYFLGQQPPYDPVVAGCKYTVCGRGGPASIITISTLPSAATGRVVSNLHGIKLSGTGKASGEFLDAVTLTAFPKGRHARAVFSGGCIETGEYGKKARCDVKLAPDPEVIVTYECQKGFTCNRQAGEKSPLH